MHPELIGSFIDIAGDLSPNSGTKAQTIDRLFGGNADAWTSFDPSAVLIKHGHYEGIWAAFVVSGARMDRKNRALSADRVETDAARRLCDLGGANGMRCAVVAMPGKHDWPFAGSAFAATLPWLTAHLQTPGAAPAPMPPGSPTLSALHGSAPPTGG
jgi:S-formylglutathione hydrolase FrmB